MTQEIKQRIEQIKRGEVPQGYKRTKVGIVPSEWEVLLIADILNKVGENVDVKQDVLYKQIGIRSHGKGIFYKEPVTGEMLGNKSVFWVQPNCLIVNIVFAWEQAISRTTDSQKGMIGSHRFPMYVPKDRKSDVDYLVYFFMTRRGKSLLEDASPGGAGRNKTLGQKEFAQSKLAVPLIVEQQKIAEILTTQDKVIELKEKLLAEKQAQKKWLMQNLLTGKKRLSGFSGKWEKVKLNKVLKETKKRNVKQDLMICSVAVQKGVVSQIEHLGRSYAASDTSKYNVASHGDIIYTKSPTGDFPFGIIKQSQLRENVAVSPLYGVYQPASYGLGYMLHCYFQYPINTNNYLMAIVQKGAKNTISISNETFISNTLYLPTDIKEQTAIAEILSTADREIDLMKKEIEAERQKKKTLMQLLLTGIVRV